MGGFARNQQARPRRPSARKYAEPVPCVFCGDKFSRIATYEAWPVMDEGRCCEKCNQRKVLPKRARLHEQMNRWLLPRIMRAAFMQKLREPTPPPDETKH
jgi:hypothetical protein